MIPKQKVFQINTYYKQINIFLLIVYRMISVVNDVVFYMICRLLKTSILKHFKKYLFIKLNLEKNSLYLPQNKLLLWVINKEI